MKKLDELLKSFADLKEQLGKASDVAAMEELQKSIDDLREQMKRNAAKKKRQKAEFDKEAQRKADTIKGGGDLATHPGGVTGFRQGKKDSGSGKSYDDFDHEGWTDRTGGKKEKKPTSKGGLTVIKEEQQMIEKAEYEKDMSIKGKRSVREGRRIETAKAKQPKIGARLKTFKENKTSDLNKGAWVGNPGDNTGSGGSTSLAQSEDDLDAKIKAKMRAEMDKRGFGEAEATRHVIDRDRGEKAPKPKKMKPLLNSIQEKNTLVKALEDAGQRESALLLKNWDEMDASATEMLKKFDLMGAIRTAVGRPAGGGLVEGAEPNPTPPRERLEQSEDDKMGCCGMPRKTCKCEVKKEEELAKPGTMTGSQGTTLTGRGTNQPGYEGNPRDPGRIIESIKGLFGG
jgi:hypothetical protein